MLTRDEALAKIRKSFATRVPEDAMDHVMEQVPEHVITSVMEGAEVQPVMAEDVRELAKALLGRAAGHRHLPGCDGDHDFEDDIEPRNGIILMDDPDGETHLGTHGLANVANLLKTIITYVATEDFRGFKRWMREREAAGQVEEKFSGPGQFTDEISPSMLAWIGLSIRNSHEDCPPDSHGGGGIPEAFRKPDKDAEPIIDPSQFRYF